MSVEQPELPAPFLSLIYSVAMPREQYEAWVKEQSS